MMGSRLCDVELLGACGTEQCADPANKGNWHNDYRRPIASSLVRGVLCQSHAEGAGPPVAVTCEAGAEGRNQTLRVLLSSPRQAGLTVQATGSLVAG
jgi:hypothetical protein